MLNTQQVIDSFDFEVLPCWAREQEDVVWLCRINLGYRRDVQGAETENEKGWCIRKASILKNYWNKQRAVL